MFWRETLNIFARLTAKVSLENPEMIYYLNIFDNEDFKYGNNQIRKYDFPIMWSKKVCQVGDLYSNTIPPRLLDRQELNDKYFMNINFLQYHQLKLGILNGVKILGSKCEEIMADSDAARPRQPLLIKIGSLQNKGCRVFYKILNAQDKNRRATDKSETKWHENLGNEFSTKYWDKVYKLPSKSLLPNKLIWTQIQINKHILPTNYSVSHYDKNVSPWCSFCPIHAEKLQFLFFSCEVVRQFWSMIANLISNFYKFHLGEKEALFGAENLSGDSPINSILSLARYFIYQQKFTNKNLDEVNFINFAQMQLKIIYQCKVNNNQEIKFVSEWKDILEHFDIV